MASNSSDKTITTDNAGTVVKNSVGMLGVQGEFVFGEIVEPRSGELTEYFLLDTTTSMVEYYPNSVEWRQGLAMLNISDVKLRGASAFFHLQGQVWWRLILFGVVLLPLLLVVWFVRLCQRRASVRERTR